jgi:type IV pilus assembly protein PilA
MDATEAAQWEAALGRNAKHYLKSFERIRTRGRWAPNWNSAAFLHSSAWFCYRRMYGLAALNLFAPLLLLVFLALLGTDAALPLALVAYLVFVFAVLPLFADAIYFEHLKGGLERTRPPSAWTGFAAAGVVLLSLLGMLAAVLPSYGDFTDRAKMSEVILAGIGMRRQVTEFYEQHGRLPGAADAARLDTTSVSRYVASIAWDASRDTVVLTMRAPFPDKHVELKPIVQSGRLVEWRCSSPDLDKKYMPGSCRD